MLSSEAVVPSLLLFIFVWDRGLLTWNLWRPARFEKKLERSRARRVSLFFGPRAE